jgi:hypothetical protein
MCLNIIKPFFFFNRLFSRLLFSSRTPLFSPFYLLVKPLLTQKKSNSHLLKNIPLSSPFKTLLPETHDCALFYPFALNPYNLFYFFLNYLSYLSQLLPKYFLAYPYAPHDPILAKSSQLLPRYFLAYPTKILITENYL